MAILIVVLVLLLLFFLFFVLKIPKLGNMSLITGAVKSGKSTLAVHLSIKTLRRQRRKYYLKLFFIKLFKIFHIRKFVNMSLPEKPLLYSNIPLKMPYVPLTKDLLLRNERFAYGSVVYICEASLVADSMTFKDALINENLLLFNKLFAHETRGGYIFYDTQSINDNHYAIKRCLSTYLDVHHTRRIPFFLLMYCRECKYSDDGSSVNTYSSDVEDTLKLVIVPKRVWKKFDCYAFSSFTDKLPVNKNLYYPVSLKVDDIISFKTYQALQKKGELKND